MYAFTLMTFLSSERDHLDNLAAVLEKLEATGVRLKRPKCHFMLPSVEYLGHKISDEGIQPTEAKIRAIVTAPAPNNVSQLKAFLGMLNYYAKFLPNISSRLALFTNCYRNKFHGHGEINNSKLSRKQRRPSHLLIFWCTMTLTKN